MHKLAANNCVLDFSFWLFFFASRESFKPSKNDAMIESIKENRQSEYSYWVGRYSRLSKSAYKLWVKEWTFQVWRKNWKYIYGFLFAATTRLCQLFFFYIQSVYWVLIHTNIQKCNRQKTIYCKGKKQHCLKPYFSCILETKCIRIVVKTLRHVWYPFFNEVDSELNVPAPCSSKFLELVKKNKVPI